MHTHLHAALQRTDRPADLREQVAAAASHRPDTIDWTEVENPTLVHAINDLPGYVTFWGSGRLEVHPKNFAPISWRGSRYRFIRGEVVKSSDGVRGEFPDKWFASVMLEDRETGERLVVVSAHMVPGIQSLNDETPEVQRLTREAHAQNVATFRHLMTRDNLPAIGGTDANDTRFPAKLGEEFTYAETGPTHGNRRIDFVVGHNLHLLTGA